MPYDRLAPTLPADHPLWPFISAMSLDHLRVYAANLFARLEAECRKVDQARIDALNEVAEAVNELLNPEPEEDDE